MVVIDTDTDLAVIDRLIEEQEQALLDRTPASAAIMEEARTALAGGVASSWQDAPPRAIWIDRGKGSKITDVDGTTYVDLHNGFGAMLVGHAHPAVVKAVQDRVALGTHFAQPVPDLIPVSQELARRFDQPKWRFANSGTEATLAAVNLMRVAKARPKILKIEGSYHGHHDAVQVSVYPDVDAAGPPERPASVPVHGGVIPEVAANTLVVPYGDVEAVRRVLNEHPGEVAGMIIEPMMMNIGVVPPPPGYLADLKAELERHDVLLTFDEVKTALTVHPGGATGKFGVTPDLICLAKSMGGGLPCGAIGGSAEIMAVVEDDTYEVVGTFNGNPLTMAAAKATLLEVLTPEAHAHLEHLRDRMADGAVEVLARHRIPGYVSAYGAKGAVIFSATRIRNYRDFLAYDGRFGHVHWLFQHNGGVFLPPWGKCEQWTLSVQHTEDDVDLFLANLEAFAAALRD
jgi:glutamate-1-semialdehyde 2,1-aminomutase